MSEKWYYATGSEKIGPVDHLQIGTLISGGQLNLKDLVWKKGMPNWDKIENIPDFIKFTNNQIDENLPPPLPANKDLPNATTDKNLVSSDNVTCEINFDGGIFYNGYIHIFAEEQFIGGCDRLKDGVHGETFQTKIGLRSLKMIYTEYDSWLASQNCEKIYRLQFDKSGHYIINFRTLPESLGKDKIGGFFGNVIKGLTDSFSILPKSFSINRIGYAKEKLDPSLYFKKMIVGLWKNTNNNDLSILMTNDGALMRADGLMAKYSWSEKYKINVCGISSDEKFEFQIISLNSKQLILSHKGQSLHLIKGKTLTELEIEKEKEIFQKEAQKKSEIFQNYASSIGSLMLKGGVAVLSAGAGIAGVCIGIGAAASSGNSSNDGQPKLGKVCKKCRGKGIEDFLGKPFSCSDCAGTGRTRF